MALCEGLRGNEVGPGFVWLLHHEEMWCCGTESVGMWACGHGLSLDLVILMAFSNLGDSVNRREGLNVMKMKGKMKPKEHKNRTSCQIARCIFKYLSSRTPFRVPLTNQSL